MMCCRDEWKGYIPPYVPRFYDGWQPAPTLVDEPISRPDLNSSMYDDRPPLHRPAYVSMLVRYGGQGIVCQTCVQAIALS